MLCSVHISQCHYCGSIELMFTMNCEVLSVLWLLGTGPRYTTPGLCRMFGPSHIPASNKIMVCFNFVFFLAEVHATVCVCYVMRGISIPLQSLKLKLFVTGALLQTPVRELTFPRLRSCFGK